MKIHVYTCMHACMYALLYEGWSIIQPSTKWFHYSCMYVCTNIVKKLLLQFSINNEIPTMLLDCVPPYIHTYTYTPSTIDRKIIYVRLYYISSRKSFPPLLTPNSYFHPNIPPTYIHTCHVPTHTHT